MTQEEVIAENAVLKAQLEALQERYTWKPIAEIVNEPKDEFGYTNAYLLKSQHGTISNGGYKINPNNVRWNGEWRRLERCQGWQYMKIPHKEYDNE